MCATSLLILWRFGRRPDGLELGVHTLFVGVALGVRVFLCKFGRLAEGLRHESLHSNSDSKRIGSLS